MFINTNIYTYSPFPPSLGSSKFDRSIRSAQKWSGECGFS